jgi:hypothetical protein
VAYSEQQKENIYAYHEIFARSIAIMQDMMQSDRKEQAKDIMIFNYIYAQAINDKKIEAAELATLKKKEIYDVLQEMVKAQKTADLIPTQHGYGRSFYARIVQKMGVKSGGNP